MQLKTHTSKHLTTPFEFYILNKGMNSGRPMACHCPNCFVCICSSQEERDFFYWMLFTLWQAKYWHPFFTGSVIEFLRLPDLKAEIQKQQERAKSPGFIDAVNKAQDMASLEKKLVKQLQLVRELKIALLRKHLL